MNKDAKQKKSFLYWPLIVAAATPLAYFYAFTYEAGYTSYFRVPQELISLSLTTIILNLRNYLSALLMLFFLINILYMITSSWFSEALQGPNKHRFFALILALSFLILNIYSRGFDITTLIFTGMLLLLILVGYLIPLLLQKIKPSNNEMASNTQVVDDDVPDIVVLLRNKYGAKTIFTILMYFLFLILIPQMLIYSIGYRAAKIQEYYLVVTSTSTNETDDMAIIKIYDDIAIISPFNRSTKETYPEFFVVDTNNIGSVMRLENIGPLTSNDR